jgi:hypothetical protein
MVASIGCLFGVAGPAWGQGDPITFSAIGDIPYNQSEKLQLQQHMDGHNLFSPSEFLVHLGDIKAGTTPCVETWYEEVAAILRTPAVPVFIVPGDNEWSDCADPDQAWTFWVTHFLRMEQVFCGAPAVEVQVLRQENFAFVQSGILFVGINKVSGLGGPAREALWQQAADWISDQLQTNGGVVRGAVIFAQMSPLFGSSFVQQFRSAAFDFAKPVLYMHGDGHSWIEDRPFPEQNILRVQVEGGLYDPAPVQVTATLNDSDMFLFERDPWPAGTAPLNRVPCVDAGSDLVATFGLGAALAGNPSDDGVPVTATLTTTWTQVGGPGTVTFDDASAANTIAHFDTTGIYELLLTADDGELVASDALFIDVWKPVAIDIQPNDPANFYRTDGNFSDKMVVDVLGSAEFDATQVDSSTIKLGPLQTAPFSVPGVVRDGNGDGHDDIRFRFRIVDVGLDCDMNEDITLTGETNGALVQFEGTDNIQTQACENSCHP